MRAAAVADPGVKCWHVLCRGRVHKVKPTGHGLLLSPHKLVSTIVGVAVSTLACLACAQVCCKVGCAQASAHAHASSTQANFDPAQSTGEAKHITAPHPRVATAVLARSAAWYLRWLPTSCDASCWAVLLPTAVNCEKKTERRGEAIVGMPCESGVR